MPRLQRSSPLAPLALAMSLLGCAHEDARAGSEPRVPDPLPQLNAGRNMAPSTQNLEALGAGNRAFAFDLYRQIAKESGDANLVFSPYSISTALAMTYAGARGTSAAEMKKVLRFELPDPLLHEAFNAADLALASRGKDQVGADGTPFRLNVSNAIWAQRGAPFEQAFLDVLGTHYGTTPTALDFKEQPEPARAVINDWVSERTEDLIPELLPEGSIDSGTGMVLTNTVYFNASWRVQFDARDTREAPFTRLDGTQVRAELMSKSLSVPYAQGDGFQAVALPYASEALSFVAVLPDAGKLASLEADLTQAWFDALRARLSTQALRVALPKLDYRAKIKLTPQLSALGMPTPLSERADFSGLTAAPVKIDDVFHEAVIKVFERGTIAAAATAVVIGATSARPPDRSVVFDRPFLYAIVDAPTGQILFLGRVTDPTAK